MSTAGRPRLAARYKTLVRAVLLLVIVYFWGQYLRRTWADLGTIDWTISAPAAGAALAFTLAGYLLRALLWAPLRRETTGASMSWLQAYRISAIAWMGRYLPGKVWAVAGKAYMSAGDKGSVVPEAVAASVDILLLQMAGLLLSLTLGVGFTGQEPWFGHHRTLALVILALGLIVWHPCIFGPIANTLLRIMRQAPLSRPPRYSRMLGFLLVDVAAFVLWTAGFAVLIATLGRWRPADFPLHLAIFSAAWVAGFIALLAPAGIGVRESVLAIGLGGLLHMQPAEVVYLTVASRLLTTIAEVLCFLSALILTPRSKLKTPPQLKRNTPCALQ